MKTITKFNYSNKARLKYVSLRHVTGGMLSTMDTVNLFNTVQRHRKDNKGTYYLKAVEPHLCGVLCEKIYINN